LTNTASKKLDCKSKLFIQDGSIMIALADVGKHYHAEKYSAFREIIFQYCQITVSPFMLVHHSSETTVHVPKYRVMGFHTMHRVLKLLASCTFNCNISSSCMALVPNALIQTSEPVQSFPRNGMASLSHCEVQF
jgi:hypothetical protein